MMQAKLNIWPEGCFNTLQSQLLNATPLFQRLGSVLLFLRLFGFFVVIKEVI